MHPRRMPGMNRSWCMGLLAVLAVSLDAMSEPLQIDPPWNVTGTTSGTVNGTTMTAVSAGDHWGTAFNDESAVYSDTTLFGELTLPSGAVGDAFNLSYAQAPGGPVDLVTITLGGPLEDPIFYIWDIDNIDANVTVSPGGSVFTSNAEASWDGDTLTATGRERGGFGAVQYAGQFAAGSEFTFLFDFDQTRDDSFSELVALGVAVVPEPTTAGSLVIVLLGSLLTARVRNRIEDRG